MTSDYSSDFILGICHLHYILDYLSDFVLGCDRCHYNSEWQDMRGDTHGGNVCRAAGWTCWGSVGGEEGSRRVNTILCARRE